MEELNFLKSKMLVSNWKKEKTQNIRLNLTVQIFVNDLKSVYTTLKLVDNLSKARAQNNTPAMRKAKLSAECNQTCGKEEYAEVDDGVVQCQNSSRQSCPQIFFHIACFPSAPINTSLKIACPVTE